MASSFIDLIFFFYIFVGLYMLSLFFFIYLPNRKKLFDYPEANPEPVSIVIPCYNEGETIAKTLDSLLNLDYPKNMLEIIVVDDRSTDNSAKIVKEYAKKNNNIKLIINKKNSGGAAEPTNIGVRAAKYDYVAVTDADSFPQPDALNKMLGFLQQDEKVGGVTCAVLAKKPNKFIQKLQSIEYLVIIFGRKLFDFIDSVYVTPGPFAVYKKKVLLEIGLFDQKNMTQDIEIAWRLIEHGYVARMSLSAKVYSETPEKFRLWWRQRVRWAIGGTQCILKHKKYVFRKGMLGLFIVPYFAFSLFLGIVGLGIMLYLVSRRIFLFYLTTKHSIAAQATLLHLQELTFTPSILNFFGIALFMLGTAFTILALVIMKEEHVPSKNVPMLLFYLTIYLAVYPPLVVHALYKLARGKYSW